MNGLMMDLPLLISSQLRHAARFHAQVEIVSRNTDGSVHRTSWGEVARRAQKLAHALVRMGIRPGDRVATVAWNNHRHLELYFAVSSMGAILHTINPRLSPEQLIYVADHAADQALFYDTTFEKLVEVCRNRADSTVRHYVALTDDGYEALIAEEPDHFDWPELDERTASSLCYTSGTEGEPKGVLYSHRSTVLHSYAIALPDALGISGADVTLPVVPMFHVNAWGVPYAAAMVGATLVLPGPGLDGKSLYELISSEQVTSLLGVPTVWLNLLAHMRSVGGRLPAGARVTVGGSAAPESLIAALEREHGARVVHAWGMTEMSPLGTANMLLPKHRALPPADQMAVKLKQGRAIFGVDMRLVDDAGRVLPHDGKAVGQLQVRGPWVASGYYERAHSPTHKDGWFDTGDVATLDPDGYMQITDRNKDLIKSGGEWISSIELESAAMSCPGVTMAAAVALQHPKWGERPLLAIVRAPGSAMAAADVQAHLAGRMPKWWLPDAIEFVDALPIGPTGKVVKRTLRERYLGYTFPE
jgi:acyl-CoA synthetase (AMP-forming)/AMP-acid ligase II